MDTQNMMNQILSVFRDARLQLHKINKGINFRYSISENAKPWCPWTSFVDFKPKSRCVVFAQFASFWLKYRVYGLK